MAIFSTGAKFANSGISSVTAGKGGVAWSNPNNAKNIDASYADATVTPSGYTQFLYFSGFNFNIPDTPEIKVTGIVFELRRLDGGVNETYAHEVYLCNGTGTIGLVSRNVAIYNGNWNSIGLDTVRWSGFYESAFYGQFNDVWNYVGLTPAIVNSPSFGFAVKAKVIGITTSNPRIDAGSGYVFYSDGVQTTNNIPLYLSVPESGSRSPPLFVWGHELQSGNTPLYLKAHELSSGNMPLFVRPHELQSGNIPLYIAALSVTTSGHIGGIPLWTSAADSWNSGLPLYLKAHTLASGNIPLYEWGHALSSGIFPLYLKVLDPTSTGGTGNIPLYVGASSGGKNELWKYSPLFLKSDTFDGSLPLYLHVSNIGQQTGNIPLYINSNDYFGGQAWLPLYIGASGFGDAVPLFVEGLRLGDYPLDGDGWFPSTGTLPLFINRQQLWNAGLPLFLAQNNGSGENNIPLYQQGVTGSNSSGLPLVVYQSVINSSKYLPLYTSGF